MIQKDLLTLHDDLCDRARALMQKKNDDYAHGSDPFANFRAAEVFGVDPRVGLLLRLQDKLKRLFAYADRGDLKVDLEGWEDSVLDVINYAVLYAGLTFEELSKDDPDPFTFNTSATIAPTYHTRSCSGPDNPQWAVPSRSDVAIHRAFREAHEAHEGHADGPVDKEKSR